MQRSDILNKEQEILNIEQGTRNNELLCSVNLVPCQKSVQYPVVRIIGVEPTWIAPPDPKSGASANFATSASMPAVRKIGAQR